MAGRNIDYTHVPIRQKPTTPDDLDPKRIALVHNRWYAQDAACQERDRTVELAVRMLAGRQHDVWSEQRGRFIDPMQFLDEKEQIFRARPVYDFLGMGAQLNVAKLTESPPVIAFEPSTADNADAQLAEVCDTVFKTIAYDTHMDDNREWVAWWAYISGQAFYKSRPTFTGPMRELAGPAVLSMDGEDGETIERVADRVPYDATGTPMANLTEGGDGYEVPEGAEPYQQPEGEIAVDVLCPLEIRSEWTNKPLEAKRWIIHRTYLTVTEVQERYGIRVKADTSGDNRGGGYLERLKRGSGYFGGLFARAGLQGTETDATADGDGYATVDEMWEKPCPDYPEGRLLVVTKETVLLDAARPFPKLEGAGPFREIACLRQPGRMFPSTPFEKAVPLQKAYNRIWAHIHEHTTKCADPIRLLDGRSGIDIDDVTNQPGLTLEHTSPPGVVPLAYAAPPGLSSDVWNALTQTREQLLSILGIPGSEGKAPTSNASGELVEQLRYNADRIVSGVAHGMVRAEAGVARDWLAMLPSLWTDEKILTYAGDDAVSRTVTVLPEMFDGSVNVRPVMDSALPETRAEKRMRIGQDYANGIFGQPGTPQAIDQYQKNVGYPNLNRAARPGGVDRMTAEHNLNELVRGTPANELVLYEQYNFAAHIDVTRAFIAAPEFLKLEEPVRQEVLTHFYTLQGAAVAAQMNQMRVMGATQVATAALASQTQAQQMALMPPAPPESPTSSTPPTTPDGPPSGERAA